MTEKDSAEIIGFLRKHGLEHLYDILTGRGKVGSMQALGELTADDTAGMGISDRDSNVLMGALGKKNEIKTSSPNLFGLFAEGKVSALSLALMENEDLLHMGMLKVLSDEDLREAGIMKLSERKRIMSVIREEIKGPEEKMEFRRAVFRGSLSAMLIMLIIGFILLTMLEFTINFAFI